MIECMPTLLTALPSGKAKKMAGELFTFTFDAFKEDFSSQIKVKFHFYLQFGKKSFLLKKMKKR